MTLRVAEGRKDQQQREDKGGSHLGVGAVTANNKGTLTAEKECMA